MVLVAKPDKLLIETRTLKYSELKNDSILTEDSGESSVSSAEKKKSKSSKRNVCINYQVIDRCFRGK